MSQEIVIDQWTWLDHKPSFVYQHKNPWTAPSWVGDHHRRLRAYQLLDGYYMNSGRNWMGDMPDEKRADRREYGDAQTVVNQIVTSLLGIDQSIVVGGDETEQNSEAAKARRTSLMEWADKENFFLKLLECERAAAKLGDSIYVLGWDTELNRPRVTVWDPGFYFPVLDPTEVTDTYPNRVHIAYEYDDEEDDNHTYVRRITWELVEVEPYDVPWSEDPATKACLMTDATWHVNRLENSVEDFSEEGARYSTYIDPDTGEEVPLDEVDLGIDFIPVVHIPNTPAGQYHYGQSSLSPVVQIVDDISSADTDLQAASATTGTPPIALSGSSAPKDDDGNITSYGPGTVLETGDGNATVIDTSRSLDALLKYKDALLGRLSVNGRVPESLLGRIKPSEVPSGIALTLSFAPHSSMIQEMRMVREVKYRILFKFVSRMNALWSEDDVWEGDDLPISLKFGTFLPADRKETVDLVVQLLSTKPPAVSLETAVRMLVEAGFPIEDAAGEVERIIKRDFDGAEALMAALGDSNVVRDYLGIEREEATPAPGSEEEPDEDIIEGEPALDALPTPALGQ